MSSPVINHDMILEIRSYLPVGKCRLLDKECNKRSYESWFLNLNIGRTKSISGYLLQRNEGRYKGEDKLQTGFVHEKRGFENNGVSIDFLPQGKVKIKACDSSHGILLCVDDTGPSKPEYIVCKPTTKQYQIIPNPIVPNYGNSLALAVTGLNPFRYKILRLSRTHGTSIRTYACEVFDSVAFTWKRLKNLRLGPGDGVLVYVSTLVQASGFLHWLTLDGNVIRFCLKTETWTWFQTPNFGIDPVLVRYEGKLGVLCWSLNKHQEGLHRLWVLESNSKKSWQKVKDIKSKEVGLGHGIMSSPSNDVVTFCRWDSVCFYNINTEKFDIVHTYRSKEYADCVCSHFVLITTELIWTIKNYKTDNISIIITTLITVNMVENLKEKLGSQVTYYTTNVSNVVAVAEALTLT